MAGRGHAYRAPARPPRFSLVAPPELTPQLNISAGAPRRNLAPPERSPLLGFAASAAAEGRRNLAAPTQHPHKPSGAAGGADGARAAHTAAARPGGGAGARRQRALSSSRRTASEMRSFMAALDRVERMGPSLHRLPADELLAIQATLRARRARARRRRLPAAAHRGGGDAVRHRGRRRTAAAAGADGGAACNAAVPRLRAGTGLPLRDLPRRRRGRPARVHVIVRAHAFHEACVREWLRRAQQVCPLCKTHACGEGRLDDVARL